MKQSIYITFLIFALICCDKKKNFDGPNFMENHFDNYSALNDLLLPNGERWSFTQLTRDGNSIVVDSTFAYSGI